MPNQTASMLHQADQGLFPPGVRAQLLSALDGQPVTAYVFHDTHLLSAEQGVGVQREVVALTRTRLLHMLWREVLPDDSDDSDDAERAHLERILNDAPAPPTFAARLRVAPLTSVVDLDLQATYVGDQRRPSALTVLVLLPTLDKFHLEPLRCAEAACAETHGFHGRAMQDCIVIAKDQDHSTPDQIDQLLAFSEAVNTALRL